MAHTRCSWIAKSVCTYGHAHTYASEYPHARKHAQTNKWYSLLFHSNNDSKTRPNITLCLHCLSCLSTYSLGDGTIVFSLPPWPSLRLTNMADNTLDRQHRCMAKQVRTCCQKVLPRLHRDSDREEPLLSVLKSECHVGTCPAAESRDDVASCTDDQELQPRKHMIPQNLNWSLPTVVAQWGGMGLQAVGVGPLECGQQTGS